MPAIENVTRRGAVYWWRRRLRLEPASANPITVVTMVSLLTKDQPAARRRAAAMTGLMGQAMNRSLAQDSGFDSGPAVTSVDLFARARKGLNQVGIQVQAADSLVLYVGDKQASGAV